MAFSDFKNISDVQKNYHIKYEEAVFFHPKKHHFLNIFDRNYKYPLGFMVIRLKS